MAALVLFVILLILLLTGYPVAFILGGVSLLFGLFFFGFDFLYLLPLRIYGTMNNPVLMAVPLFVFMGMMLERSGIAERLLETMALLLGKVRGGLALAVVIVGAMLAASTGIVGASVVTMGLLSLPTMLRRGYSPTLAGGTIAASGTLGQIIPPSIVLVLLGSVMNVSVGNLFKAALVPSLLLVIGYLLFIIFVALVKPKWTPKIPPEELEEFRKNVSLGSILQAFVFPFLLILAVLGSIFMGIASPTESAAIGAMGALVLALVKGKLNLSLLLQVSKETTHLTSMVFMILIGATVFGLVFRGLEGDVFLTELVKNMDLPLPALLLTIMIFMFIAGFFIDFIEIIFIFVPVILPIFTALEVDMIWLGILISLNLQTSFLTPPFGFSLFYLKGVAPPELTTQKLYRGVVPFILMQIALIAVIAAFPNLLSFFM